jgi:uncharacterized membrane protein
MSLLTVLFIVIILAFIGWAMWVFNTRFTKIDETYKWLINIFVALFVIYWLLKITCLWAGMRGVSV